MPTPAAAPTPEKLDQSLLHYQTLCDAADAAEEERAQAEKHIVQLVRAHGQRPDRATQSIVLRGIHSEALVTMGVTRSLDEGAVAKLREYMSGQMIGGYFGRMFSAVLKYTLIDGAQDALSGVDLPKATRNKVLQYFGMCIVVRDQKPKLKVTAVKATPAKMSRRAKVAA